MDTAQDATTTHSSPLSPPVKEHSDWAKAIVGRDWEIFWNDEEEEEEEERPEHHSNNQKQSAQETMLVEPRDADRPEGSRDVESNNSVPGDVRVSESEHVTPEGSTSKKKEKRRGNQSASTGPMETEETSSATQQQQDETSDAEMSDSSDEEAEYEEGWYMGHIQEYLGNDDQGMATFRIRFVGDEENYEMPLRPEHVRPCNQRWIIRSLALLRATNLEAALDNLPPDTSLPRDTQALSSIRAQYADVSFPTLVFPKEQEPIASLEGELCPTFGLERLQRVLRGRCLLEEQIYLRSKLGPVEEGEADSYAYDTGCDPQPAPPSEAYINHLTQSMKQVLDATAWVKDAYELLSKVYGDEHLDPSDRITRDMLMKIGLEKAQEHVRVLSTMDVCSCPNKRKRKAPVKSPVADKLTSRRLQNRNKRQRIKALFKDDEPTASSQHASLPSAELDLQPQDLWGSTDLVMQYLRRMLPDPPPWYFDVVADMMRILVVRLIEKYRNWEQNAKVILGQRASELDDGTSESTELLEVAPPVDEDDEGEKEENFVSYQAILSAIESTQRDLVLSRFDFSHYVPDLRQKLIEIENFEIRCWREIGRVLEDVGSLSPESDPLLTELRRQLKIANDPASSVGNIHPLGRPSTDLTREVIENAVVYRLWFLDLLYAESTRERADFLENVVGRLSRLPPFQSPVVKSPSESAVDLSLTLDAIAPRAQALSKRVLDNVVISNRYKTTLNDRQGATGNYEWLKAKVDLDQAFIDLGKASVLSVTEEMALCRKDVIHWLSEAEKIVSKEAPSFLEVETMYKSLDSLQNGECCSRLKAVRNLRPNSQVDGEIKRFILADLEPFKDRYVIEIQRLFSMGNAWKGRYDSIAAGLRAHGNKHVDGPATIMKGAAMIDFKRVEDLLEEYKTLPVTLEKEFNKLRAVHHEASEWVAMVHRSLLSDDSIPFDEALAFTDNANAENVRPRGVIVQPTRQVLSTLSDFLRWNQQVRFQIAEAGLDMRPYDLMSDGIEILEAYSLLKRDDGWYSIAAEEITALLMEKASIPKSRRNLSVQKLQSNPLTESFLQRMLGQIEETRGNFPLGHLVFFAWELKAESLLGDIASSPKGSHSVDELCNLLRQLPVFKENLIEDLTKAETMTPYQSLRDLVVSYQEKEEAIRATNAKSKAVQRECIRKPEDVRTHYAGLKDIHNFVKGSNLSIDRDLEIRLEREMKLFSWMSRCLEYQVLRSDDLPDETDETDNSNDDGRIPWEALLKLHDSRPPVGEDDTGGLACLVMRVCELHEMAWSWQQEISSFTQLSLRGGKRREITKGPRDDVETQDSEQLGVPKLTELCRHPVLDKVSMPREAAMQSMLEHSVQFEIRLHQFLGKDYHGLAPDRAPYPRGTSLVEDGHFIPFRLTGSPLYLELKDEISRISVIASNVFAETPGKKTFDWIVQAVEWIDLLNESFSRNDSEKLSLGMKEAERLLTAGEVTLMDVSDDLKQTLSQHQIFISVSKEGKLTVKSKKKGAQHAVGTTMIRWCPILYDALKSDLSRSQQWASKFESLNQEYSFFESTKGEALTEDFLLKCHMFQQEMSDLRHEVGCLVVAPQASMVAHASSFVESLEGYLKVHSSPELKKKASDMFFRDGKNVVRSRASLRDALLDRLVSVGGALAPSSRDEKHGLPFRYAARTVLKKALSINAGKLDLQVSSASIASLCEFKAFEIEKALFQQYPGVGSEERISPEYRQQALVLKRGLGDVGNIDLCLQVLTGKIDPAIVASMPSEKLANPKLRMERAKAENTAKQASILTNSISEGRKKPAATGEEGHATTEIARDETKVMSSNSSLKAKKAPSSLEANEESLGTAVQTARILRKSRSGVAPPPPPPPPPSLASSFNLQSETATLWAKSTAGTEHFLLSLANNLRNFSAGLVLEGEGEEVTVPLPENLVEKGRLAIENFSDFVKTKVRSGKWGLQKFRVISDTDSDETELVKFCKEYEAKGRLSMLSLDGGNKVFIIPPKFQPATKSMITFEMGNMVYAVLLFRR